MHPLNSPKQSLSGGWSKSGELQLGNPLQELSLQCNFPQAGFYTVQFGVQVDPAILVPDIVAEVTWSVEGNDVRRKISVANGATISGTGQACRVVIRDETAGIVPPGANYSVFALVSPGTRPGSHIRPLLRTPWPVQTAVIPAVIVGDIAFIPPGGTANIDVPVNAGATSIDVEGALNGAHGALVLTDLVVAQIGAAPFPVKGYYPWIETGFVPLAPKARTILISNESAADTIAAAILWGIDG
jgi:hypothetical protein